MTNNLLILSCLLVLVNLIAFVLVGIDKKRSVHNAERVPEVYLFFIAVFFAALGVGLGMLWFRHKTRKLYFVVGMGLLFLEQAALLILLAQVMGQ